MATSALNKFFPGVRAPRNLNTINAVAENILVEQELETNGNVVFNSSLTVTDNITSLTGDIVTSSGSIISGTTLHSGTSIGSTTSITAGTYLNSAVVSVPLYNTGGGAVSYVTSNTDCDFFVNSTLGNLFIITAPAGCSLTHMNAYFNPVSSVPGNTATVNGTTMTLLFINNASQSITVNIGTSSIIKRTSNSVVVPSNNRYSIVFAGYSGVIVEVSRSGAMSA